MNLAGLLSLALLGAFSPAATPRPADEGTEGPPPYNLRQARPQARYRRETGQDRGPLRDVPPWRGKGWWRA